jgi:Tfp pilus assembly protein PilF
MALRSGHKDKAIVQMRQAADIEDKTEKHIAMENRLSPMRELLGELLLEADEPALAIQEFEAALRTTPNRYRSIAGAMKAAERLGDGAARQRYSEMLVDLGNSADTERPDLLKARQYLATR